jgi:hypothetical protein
MSDIFLVYCAVRFARMSDTLQEALNKWSTPWSAAARRRFGQRRLVAASLKSTQAGVAATGRDRPKRCQASALQGVVAST